MLATSVRVRPCSARCSPRSVGRVTTIWSSLCSIFMSRWTLSESSPRGPLTVTRSGSTATVTPAGTGMGCLPMRDMLDTGLPDLGHHFAAHAGDPRLVSGHHTPRRRDDRRAHDALHARDVRVVDVGALPRARDALQPGDDRLARLGVLERDVQVLSGTAGRGVAHLVVLYVALLAQDPRDLAAQLRGRDRHVLVL